MEGAAAIRSKREKRREDRYRNESPTPLDTLDVGAVKHEYGDRERERERERDYERNERTVRDRDRDLSSVSNESNGSLQQQRRSQDMIEYDKGRKR